jgi:hypothetical protein
MVDVQTIGVLVTAVSVSVAAIYYAFTLRINLKNQELMLKTQESSVKTQELALKAQQQNLETRQAQLFMQIFDKFIEPEFSNKLTQVMSWKWVDYDDFNKKYGPKANPDAWQSEGSIAAFFEGIGLLIYMNLLDSKLVYSLLFQHVKFFWEKMKPISLEMRQRVSPNIDRWIEYLYSEMMKIEEQQVKPWSSV